MSRIFIFMIFMATIAGCGDGGKPEPGPTDDQSIKTSQDEQKRAAEGEGASLKNK